MLTKPKIMIDIKFENEAEFNVWLNNMESALNEFKKLLPKSVADKLDYSKESLQILENWLLETYESLIELKADDNFVMLDGASRYVGEVFKRITNSEWYVTLDDTDITNKRAVLRKGINELSHTTPFFMITAPVKLREGDYLMKCANKMELAHGSR